MYKENFEDINLPVGEISVLFPKIIRNIITVL